MQNPSRRTRSLITAAAVGTLAVLSARCSSTEPLTPRAVGPSAALSWGPETPRFNLEVVLRAPAGGGAQGSVKFRQPNDDALIVDLGTSVRDLDPNTHYSLQRAADAPDGVCTSTAWLTLGKGSVAQDLVTDDRGSADEDLWRNLGAFSPGATFDIRFRVVITGTTAVVLESGCYQFTISQ